MPGWFWDMVRSQLQFRKFYSELLFDTKYKIITPAAAANHRAFKDTSETTATFYCICKILQQSFKYPDYRKCLWENGDPELVAGSMN